MKSVFIDTLNSILLAQEFIAFGFKASEASASGLNRHGQCLYFSARMGRRSAL